MGRDEPEKGLTDDEREHLATILRRVRDTRCEGNGTELARLIGVSQSQLSQILRGKKSQRSAGIPVLKRIRAFTGLTIDDLIGLRPLEPVVPDSRPRPPSAAISQAERLAYEVIAAAEAERRTPTVPPPPEPDEDRRPRRRH